MHYVKQFKINGVDTRQVACIELRGAPNAATEGSLGALGIDVTSPTHEVYKCVAVNGSVYTWELLSGGMSIMSANITGEGAMSMAFPYTNIIAPNNYIFKSGDLILDSEGYLYQIETIGATECYTTYCGTHIGGIASGDKDCRLVIENGKLQLVTESGKVLSEVDCLKPDGDTIYRDESTGVITSIGVKTVGGTDLRLFVGTKAEYDALTEAQKQGLFAIITDESTQDDLLNGTFVVGKAKEVEHLYLHTIRVALAVEYVGREWAGDLILTFRFTSPRSTFDNIESLIMIPENTATYCDGDYCDTEGEWHDIIHYENRGYDSSQNATKITIGTLQDTWTLQFSTYEVYEQSAIQLY